MGSSVNEYGTADLVVGLLLLAGSIVFFVAAFVGFHHGEDYHLGAISGGVCFSLASLLLIRYCRKMASMQAETQAVYAQMPQQTLIIGIDDIPKDRQAEIISNGQWVVKHEDLGASIPVLGGRRWR